MALDLATAEKIAHAGLAHAKEMGIKVSFAVVDDAGNPMYMARMDGAPFFAPNLAMGKAFVASAWRISSGEIEKRAQSAPYFYESAATASGGRMIIRQGALPIVIGGVVVGAAGVSGGTSAEDEEVVAAGLKSIA
ncbi:MAG TPA: heme-binding protein [Chloroflexota bacterium]|nr:heme-binding protein [Chloroflexota bacterium]